jgi:hypothetical protein
MRRTFGFDVLECAGRLELIALIEDRIRLTSEGNVMVELCHRSRDGIMHLRFIPGAARRAASLTPRPRINLVLYYVGWRHAS